MPRNLQLALIGTLLAVLSVGPAKAIACPFCTAVGKTLREETKSMATVVIGKLVKQAPPPAADSNSGFELAKATFEVQEILKGAEHIKGIKTIDTFYFEKGQVGKTFLLQSTAPPELQWSQPVLLSDEAVAYLRQVMKLPEDNAEVQLRFYLPFLRHKDTVLARDSYDEFANAPYQDLAKIKKDLNHNFLVKQINDPETPTTERRLYFTLLSICGSQADVPMLESLLKSEDSSKRVGLDSLLSCYITLHGAKAMPLIEEQFLINTKAPFSDTYSAVNAIRFQGTEMTIVPRERLVQSLRTILGRPDLADLVIADLTRWEDWESLPKLVQIFKDATKETKYIRVPIVRYVLKCPLPEAKTLLAEMEKVDADSVKRGKAFPFGTASKMAITNQSPTANDVPKNVTRPEDKKKPQSKDDSSKAAPDKEAQPPSPAIKGSQSFAPPVPPSLADVEQPQLASYDAAADVAPAPPEDKQPVDKQPEETLPAKPAATPVIPAAKPTPADADPSGDRGEEPTDEAEPTDSNSEIAPLNPPNMSVLLGVTGGAGVALFAALWLILRSAGS